MPHLRPLTTEESGDARRALESLGEKLGQVPNMYRTFAHAPLVLDAAIAMARAIRTDLPAKDRELIYLKVIQLTDCEVCRHYHEIHGRRAGLTDVQLNDLDRFENSEAYTDAEKELLRFAEQWTLKGRVADEVMRKLKTDFSASQLVILAATAAQANLTCRFNNVLAVQRGFPFDR